MIVPLALASYLLASLSGLQPGAVPERRLSHETRSRIEKVDVLPPVFLNQWLVSNWSDGPSHSSACRSDHVQASGSALKLTLDALGEGELQTRRAYDTGIFEFDVTIPKMRSGQLATAFLYDRSTGDEVDFEVVGTRGLQLALHQGGQQRTFWPSEYQGDLSGRRIRGMITVRAGASADWELDGKPAWSLTPGDMKTGKVTSSAMHFMFSNWGYKTGPANWAGRWQPMGDAEASSLIVHGFRYTQI